MSDRDRAEPRPNEPGYGDQGPAGGGRTPPPDDKAAEDEDAPEPVDDLGG